MYTNVIKNHWQGQGFTGLPMADVRIAAIEPKYQADNFRPDITPGLISLGGAKVV